MNLSGFFTLLLESLLFLGIGITLISYFVKGKYSKRITYIFSYTYSLKIIIGAIIVRAIINEKNTSFLARDLQRAAGFAENISQAGMLSYSHYVPYGLDWLPYYYAAIFNLTGSSSIYVMAAWSLVASLLVIPVYIISKHYFSGKVAYLSSIITLVYPSFFVLSFVPHKDVLSALFLCLSALCLLKYEFSVVYVSLLSLTIVGLLTVRPEMVIVLILSYVIWRIFLCRRSLSTSFIVLSTLVLVLVSYMTYSLMPPLYIDNVFSIEALRERLTDVSNIGGGGGGIQETILRQNIFVRTFFGSVFLLIKPFPPTKTLTSLDLPALLTPSAFVIYLIMPFVLYGAWVSIMRRGDETFLVVLAILTLVAAAATTGGAAVRYRIQVMPFLLMFGSYGFCLPGKKHLLLVSYYSTLLIGIAVYMMLKVVTGL